MAVSECGDARIIRCSCGWYRELYGSLTNDEVQGVLEEHLDRCEDQLEGRERLKVEDRREGRCWVDVLNRVGSAHDRYDIYPSNPTGEWRGGIGFSPFKESCQLEPQAGDTVRLYGNRPWTVWGMDRWNGESWEEIYYFGPEEVAR